MSAEIEIFPASATVKTTSVFSVATNVCSEDALIPVNIDCSLCAIGFPQAGGTIGITFYGPICDQNTVPAGSRWLGESMKMATWRCPNPGQGSEPAANLWRAIGYFDGIKKDDTCYNKYKFIATLTASGPSKISVSVSVYVLNETPSGNVWEGYTTFGEQLTEIVNLDTTRYRIRNFGSPQFLPISTSASANPGDPVSYAKIMVIMNSMRGGCDSFDFSLPTCGFWNGTRWLTCLQAFVKTRNTTSIRAFGQLGFRKLNCGTAGNYCECDEFTLTSLAPLDGTAEYNNDFQFFQDYGVLGIAGGVEAVGAIQQIQFGRVGDSQMGGIVNIAVKMINGNLYCCTNDGSGWICGTPNVVQNNSPHIMLYQPVGKDYDVILYAMQFPNENILPTECSSGGNIPEPSPNDPYWCVGEECVKSALQPSGARAGPYGSLNECNAYCVLGQIPYWCWYGKCVQRITQPAGSTGPFANAAACADGGCGPEVLVYVCNGSGNCEQMPKWAAIQDDYEYWDTLAQCQQSCSIKWYCASDGDCYQWTKATAPPWAISGPYNNQAACEANCVPVANMDNQEPIVQENAGHKEDNLSKDQSEIIKRIKLPCVYLGESITGTNKSGCGSCHTHKCSIHGECKKFDNSGKFKQCITCEDYSNG